MLKVVLQHPSIESHDSAYILDGKAIVHMLKAKPKTFGELFNAYITQLMKLFESGVQCVDVVFDIYGRGKSIKSMDMER